MFFLCFLYGAIMVVYIEDCLIENYFVTLLLLLTTRRIFNDEVKNTKICIASVFGAVISVLYPIFNLSGAILIVFKILVGIIIVCIAFSKKYLLAKCVCFMFLTALYGGINILVYSMVYDSLEIQDNFPTYILLMLLFVTYYLSVQLINILKKQSKIAGFVYYVEIQNNGLNIKEKAFLDSGNVLVDNDGSPVFLVNMKVVNKLYNNITFEDLLLKNYKNLKSPHYVKSGFASGGGKILVFNVELMKIQTLDKIIQINNAHIGISYTRFDINFNCNVLLNANAFV